MKKIFRKNQVVITTLAFLIAIAGYISYDRSNAAKDEHKKAAETIAQQNDTKDGTYDITLVENTQSVETSVDGLAASEVANTGSQEATQTDAQADTDAQAEEIVNPGEAVLTSTMADSVDYAAQVKLNREQIRSKNKESLNAIIQNESLSEEQKQAAVDELVTLTNISEKEADAELMLEAKGFTSAVVSIDDETCDVVVDMGEVTDAKCAQVEDIVKRKTGIAADKIIITPIGKQAAETMDSLEQ